MPFVNFEETSKLIGYDNNLLTEEIKVVDNTERSIRSNYFLTKPQGIIIQDTYNNFLFPIRPRPRLDTKKCDLIELTHWYRQLYLSFKSNFLPWHFVVEFIDGRYYVFNTRPIDIRFPLSHDEAMKKKDEVLFDVKWDAITTEFMEKRRFLIEEGIHVCVIGDSSIDVYPKQFYRMVGDFCVKPFIHYFRLPSSSKTRTFAFNMGSKFNEDYLFKFMYSQ